MNNKLVIFSISILLTSCNTIQENKTPVKDIDSLTKNTSIEKANQIFNNPFRDINNFDIKVNDSFIDELHNEYSNNDSIEIEVIKDICVGDACESHQKFVNKKNNTTFYFFKGDVYEYGFSNNQYILIKDSLTFVRNFSVTIETWPSDSTETTWRIEEWIYDFRRLYNDSIYSTKRITTRKNLDQIDFTSADKIGLFKQDFKKAYKDKSLELKKHLERKELE